MNRLENLRGRITGPKAKIAAVGIAVATVGAACTPEQIAMVESAFPCPPPADVASIGETGTGTEPVSGERGDSQTAALDRFFAFNIPAQLTNGEQIIVCLPNPNAEQAIARPTPTATPEATQTPDPKTIQDLIKTKKNGLKTSKIPEVIDATYKNNPQAGSIEKISLTKKRWNECLSGTGMSTHRDENQREKCGNFIYINFNLYQRTGDPVFYDLAVSGKVFAKKVLPKRLYNNLIEYLGFVFPA